MAYDEDLDASVAAVVLPWGATRKTMFGGTGYMLGGNMVAGVNGSRVILRLSAEVAARALEDPRVMPFDMTPRPMAGWVMIEREDLRDDELVGWLEQARTFVETLPHK